MPPARQVSRMADPFRELMSRFPTGVAVVASVDARGAPSGMTVTSLASVCLNPPTLLVCLRTGSTTLATVQHRGGFAVNLLHARARSTAELFAAPVADRFARVRWRLSGNGLPWLVDDAAAMADCRLVRQIQVGDHTVVLGEILHLAIERHGPLLLYGMRRFAQWHAGVPLSSTAPSAATSDHGVLPT
jgi:flavin reductase (DIM6/NTAB) family NADH-FMN oxidoreductase RutF